MNKWRHISHVIKNRPVYSPFWLNSNKDAVWYLSWDLLEDSELSSLHLLLGCSATCIGHSVSLFPLAPEEASDDASTAQSRVFWSSFPQDELTLIEGRSIQLHDNTTIRTMVMTLVLKCIILINQDINNHHWKIEDTYTAILFFLFTCMFPIRRAKRISPIIAITMENKTSLG